MSNDKRRPDRLQALERCWMDTKQIEAARVAITRFMKRRGKVWIRVFPDKSYTTKPLEPSTWDDRPPCSAPTFDPAVFPNAGVNSADIHPPTYFLITYAGAATAHSLSVMARLGDMGVDAPLDPLGWVLHDLADLGRAAVAATYGPTAVGGPVPATERFQPDAAIVNLYTPDARLGLHQDGEEPSDAPVVTISLGDTATFRLAAPDRRTGPFTDVELHSGDLLVFGGPNRRIFHGVPRVRPDTAPEGLGLPPGRLSITLRETGLS